MRLRGILFLTAGLFILLVINAGSRRRETVKLNHRQWNLFLEPSPLEKSLAWTGLSSAVLGGTLLLVDIAKRFRRGSQ